MTPLPRVLLATILAVLLALALTGCCSMSRRPVPGICAAETSIAT